MKKEYSMIDIFKLIFAIGILGVHTPLFKSENVFVWTILHCFFRLAVPFFFCVSGFFFYKSLEKGESIRNVTKKYFSRLLIPFFFWLILNTPIKIFEYIQLGDSFNVIIIKMVRGALFYPWGAMWYLSALIVAILLVIPFYKKNKLNYALFISAILYLFALVCNTYYFVVEGSIFQGVVDIYLKITTSARNGFFEAFFFVSVGMFISKKIAAGKVSFKINNIVFPILYLLLIIEVLLTKNLSHRDDHSLFLTFLLLIPSLFIFLSQFDVNMDTTKIRNYSTGIFFSHRFVLGIVKIVFPDMIIVDFTLSLLIIIILLTILYKVNNKRINYLIR